MATLEEEIFLKVLVLGDLGVGKSSLIKQYVENDYTSNYKVSVIPSYTLKCIQVNEVRVNVQLWDIPGHERFGRLTKILYKYSHGALIVFDLSRHETFDTALSWLEDVIDKQFNEQEIVPIVLLANKIDLPEIQVSRDKYEALVRDRKLLSWQETSSKEDTGIKTGIKILIEHILKTDPTLVPINERLCPDLVK